MTGSESHDAVVPPAESEPEERRRGEPRRYAALEEELRRAPRSFAFFQAVRVLEWLFPGRARVGSDGDPAGEVARFSVAPFISFPAAEIQQLELGEDGPAALTVNFMGLTGPLGVLPFDYTLLVAERLSARDRTLKDFLDIFHHRIISLFYRAWEKSQFTVGYETGQRDRITEHLLDLVGLGLRSYQDRLAVDDEGVLFYTGLLAPQQRSAVRLQQMLEDYFGVPVEIEQFVGGWYPLTSDTLCHLGDDSSGSNQLGLGAVAGDEIWDQQARVRIRIGPLSREQYDRFLPSGRDHAALRDLTRFFSGEQFDFEIQLVLARDEVPGCVIGAEEEEATPLGWSTWVCSAPFDRDADEAILTL